MFIADMPIGQKKVAEPAKPAVADEPPLMRRLEDEIGKTVTELTASYGPFPTREAYKAKEEAVFRELESFLIDTVSSMRRYGSVNIFQTSQKIREQSAEIDRRHQEITRHPEAFQGRIERNMLKILNESFECEHTWIPVRYPIQTTTGPSHYRRCLKCKIDEPI